MQQVVCDNLDRQELVSKVVRHMYVILEPCRKVYRSCSDFIIDIKFGSQGP